MQSNNQISSSNFFADGNNIEIQKMTLSKMNSKKLATKASTNLLFHALMIEILFERHDETAITFQSKLMAD